jgi:hypothetical protein
MSAPPTALRERRPQPANGLWPHYAKGLPSQNGLAPKWECLPGSVAAIRLRL